MEISLVTKSSIPRGGWTKILRQSVNAILSNGNKNVIQIILNKNENYDSLKSAWRILCVRDLKKQPRSKLKRHELGKTVWLWWE